MDMLAQTVQKKRIALTALDIVPTVSGLATTAFYAPNHTSHRHQTT